MRTIFGMILVLLLGTPAMAEYRAFELKISKKDNPEDYRLVLSNLDPFQYVGYYPVRDDEIVQYTRTWKCQGRTSGQPICPDPKQVAAQAALEAAEAAEAAAAP